MTPQDFDRFVAHTIVGEPRRVALGKRLRPSNVQIKPGASNLIRLNHVKANFLNAVPSKWPAGVASFYATAGIIVVAALAGISQFGTLSNVSDSTPVAVAMSVPSDSQAGIRLPPPVSEPATTDPSGLPIQSPAAPWPSGVEVSNEPYPLPNPQTPEQPRTGQPLQPQAAKSTPVKANAPKAEEPPVKAVVVDVPEKQAQPMASAPVTTKQPASTGPEPKEPTASKTDVKSTKAQASETKTESSAKAKQSEEASKPTSSDKEATRITIVDIHSKGEFALITDPKTRLPKKYGIGEKIHTGETLNSIDPASGSIKVGERVINIQ